MYFHCQMPLIVSLLCFLFPFCMFIYDLSLHRNQRDFQDGLPLINLSGCAQPCFSAGNEARNERLQNEPFVQREGVNKKNGMKFCLPIRLSISQTPEGNDSRTYASLDESKREAKDIEYDNLISAHGYVNASPSENASKAMVNCWLEI